MKDRFNPKASKEDLEKVRKFLSSKDEMVYLPRMCPELFKDIAEKIGIDIDWDSMDTNGWEWDYWMDAKYKNQDLSISGSGFYGYGKIVKE